MLALLRTVKKYEAEKRNQAKRSASEPAAKKGDKKNKTEPRPVSVVSVKDEVARVEDNIKPKEKVKARARSARSRSDEVETARPPTAKAKAKARPRNDDDIVVAGNVTLNNNADRDYWNGASANEIKNQHMLRGIPYHHWKDNPDLN